MPGATLKRTRAASAWRMRRFPIPRPTTVRRNNTRACGEQRGAFQRSNATHCATRWAKGVQKWREPAIYPPKPTVEVSVFGIIAVRHNDAR